MRRLGETGIFAAARVSPFEPKEFGGPEAGMEPRAGSVVSFAFVEPLAERRDVLATLIVGPAVNGCRRLTVRINAHQTVPEGTGRNVSDVALQRSFCENLVDGRHDLPESYIRVDLGSAYGRRFQPSLDLDEGLRKKVSDVIEAGGADA